MAANEPSELPPADRHGRTLLEMWEHADTGTQRWIAGTAQLPAVLQHLAATHHDAVVRATYCASETADPQTLACLAATERDHGVLAALMRNPLTPADALIPRLADDRDLWLLALGRDRAERELRREALRNYAAHSDAAGSAAAAQITRLIGEDPDLWSSVVPHASPQATGLVLAASRLKVSNAELIDRLLDWLERHQRNALGAADTDLIRATAAIGEHPTSTIAQRRRALDLLGGRNAGEPTLALIRWESGALQDRQPGSGSTQDALGQIELLQSRVPHHALGEAAATQLEGRPEQLWRDHGFMSRLRALCNPLVGHTLDALWRRGAPLDCERVLNICGVAALDHCSDPWTMIAGLDLPLEGLLRVRVLLDEPRRTLALLHPLAEVCRREPLYLTTVIEEIAALDDEPARQTASALAHEWQGTLSELLDAATALR